ncbi:MAG: PulJ/GspJ family protein [Planctomycetota bacterium]|jgi:type II secretory pathway pseudopilin PulG
MTLPRHTSRPSARGLTLLELIIAIAITSMIGLGISSMLTMVAQGTRTDQDHRTSVIRVHALNVRLRAYLSDSLNFLHHDPSKGLAVWVHDLGSDRFIHLTELRVIWWDEATSTLSVERVEFPADWSSFQRQAADIAVASDTDFFSLVGSYRASGHTISETLLDNIQSFSLDFNNNDTQLATQVEVHVTEHSAAETQIDSLQTFGLANHTLPRR